MKSEKILILHSDPEFSFGLENALKNNGFTGVRVVSDVRDAEEICSCAFCSIIVAQSSLLLIDNILFIRNTGKRSRNGGTTDFILVTDGEASSDYGNGGIRRHACCIRKTDDYGYIVNLISDTIKSQKYVRDEPNVRRRIYSVLNSYGIPENLKGYKYMCSAVQIVLDNPEQKDLITKFVYPKIARMYKTSVSAVECALRRVVSEAWESSGRETEKPSNCDFIVQAAEKVSMFNQIV